MKTSLHKTLIRALGLNAGRRRWAKRLAKLPRAAGVAIVAGGLMFAGPAPPAEAVDLVQNGSFESNNGFNGDNSGFGWYNDVDPFAFDVYDYVTQVYYEGTAPVGSGQWYYHTVGINDDAGVFQTVDLTTAATAAQIDAGTVQFDYSAHAAGYTPQSDRPIITLQFFDGIGSAIGSPTVFDGADLGPGSFFVEYDDPAFDPISNPPVNPIAAWKLYQQVSGVPIGARTASVTITGGGNDNYADLIGLDVADTGTEQFLALVADPASGNMMITNRTGQAIDINFYQVLSDSNSLNPSGWVSLDDQNTDAIGENPGESWSEGGGSDASELVEAFLLGTSEVANPEQLLLGGGYNTTVNAQDLQFFYGLPNGQLLPGIVGYGPVDPPDIFDEADFNRDGSVDGDDFLLWQTGFGTPSGAEKMDGDYDNDGDVDGDDFLGWQAEFGNGGGDGASAVPEPSTLGLVGLVLAGLTLGWIRRKKGGQIMKRCALPAIAVSLAIAATAPASSTDDRLYEMGENEGGSTGASVFTTNDSVGTFPGIGGNIQNLDSAFITQTYVDVGPSGLNRPGAASGALGIEFDATDLDHIKGDRLGLPDTSAASINGDVFGPEDYSGLVDRGFQLWVRPATLTGSRQDIVMDTFQHGFGITADGAFFMQYAGAQFDGDVSAVPTTWYHVMVVRPSGPASGSRMYVDGVVVAAAPGGYDGADNSLLVLGASTGDEFTAGMSNYFSGVLDDLAMFVMGTSTETQVDWGEFNALEDNDFIAEALDGVDPADVNLDGLVQGNGTGSAETDDVTAFVDGWLTEKIINTVAVGDLATRANGDLNVDGIIDLYDWSILNAANPSMGAAALRGIRGVPEPSSAGLLVLGLIGLAACRRREVMQHALP